MPGYKLSGRAENDLTQVYLYSFERFGEAQADAYSLDLVACFQLLSEQPRLGKLQPGKTQDRRAFVHRGHIIAYRITAVGILVQRVLGGRQDWPRILEDD